MYYCHTCNKCLSQDIVYFHLDNTYCSRCCPWDIYEKYEHLHKTFHNKIVKSFNILSNTLLKRIK